MNSIIAFAIVTAIILGSMGFGVLAVRKIKMTPQELVVGNRSFATILLCVLFAGETVTSFTFLGASGWAYSRGAPAFYILGYFPATLIVLFLLGPTIWRRGRESKFLTNAVGRILRSTTVGLRYRCWFDQFAAFPMLDDRRQVAGHRRSECPPESAARLWFLPPDLPGCLC